MMAGDVTGCTADQGSLDAASGLGRGSTRQGDGGKRDG